MTRPSDAAPTAWGTPRSKTITWYDPITAAAEGRTMSGIEHLRAMVAGVLPPPSIASVGSTSATKPT